MDCLEKLRSGLIVSCQPVSAGPMDRRDIITAMAQAAIVGGAAGVRIEGVDNVKAVRTVITAPVIGIVKRDNDWTPVRITPSISDVEALILAGADIVGYDATPRPRIDSRGDILRCILDNGAYAMADCATLQDGVEALAGGAQILGTTLSGYTQETAGYCVEPDFGLVGEFRELGAFVVAEGRYNNPDLASAAMKNGADCVTVGTAITRLEHVTGWFSSAVRGGQAA